MSHVDAPDKPNTLPYIRDNERDFGSGKFSACSADTADGDS